MSLVRTVPGCEGSGVFGRGVGLMGVVLELEGDTNLRAAGFCRRRCPGGFCRSALRALTRRQRSLARCDATVPLPEPSSLLTSSPKEQLSTP